MKKQMLMMVALIVCGATTVNAQTQQSTTTNTQQTEQTKSTATTVLEGFNKGMERMEPGADGAALAESAKTYYNVYQKSKEQPTPPRPTPNPQPRPAPRTGPARTTPQ